MPKNNAGLGSAQDLSQKCLFEEYPWCLLYVDGNVGPFDLEGLYAPNHATLYLSSDLYWSVLVIADLAEFPFEVTTLAITVLVITILAIKDLAIAAVPVTTIPAMLVPFVIVIILVDFINL
jgi:hypothetical protein